MNDDESQADQQKVGSQDNWTGHLKNVQPDKAFETEVKFAQDPARQQAAREAQIKHENLMYAKPKPVQADAQPAMPTGSSSSIYPDAETGLTSSQSQTPRFHFDTDSQIDSSEKVEPTAKKSFFKRMFKL